MQRLRHLMSDGAVPMKAQKRHQWKAGESVFVTPKEGRDSGNGKVVRRQVDRYTVELDCGGRVYVGFGDLQEAKLENCA